MKAGSVKQLLVMLLIFSVVGSIVLVPVAKAINFSYTDISSADLSVSCSSSTIKPGDSVIVSVTLTLNVYFYGQANVKIWLYSSGMVPVTLKDEPLMYTANW
ncbi:MAG: hypothetical protein GX638_11425, partial [Crenarchaeota archaeon]|nr:hypothetical protein [Thermoproteota archaeon]